MNGSGTGRVMSRMWFVVVSVVVIAILYLAKVLFLPLAFAILFAFLLAPLVSGLERLHLPRALGAILVIAGFATLLGAAAWMLFTQLVGVTNDLPSYRENITQKLEAIHSPSNSAFARAQREVERLSEELGLANSSMVIHTKPGSNEPPEQPVPVREVARPTGRLDQLGGILEPLTTAFLCVVFTFFMLLQREDLRNRLIHLSGDHNLTIMTHAMKDAGNRISRYFLLQLLVNLTYGTLVFAALYSIGLPHAALFGSMAGLLRFFPYVWAPIAALLPTLLSLAVFHGWMHSALIVGTFLVLELVTANYAEPRIYGKHTGLSSLAILVAAAFWTLIWGPVGLVLSVPLTVCLVVMGSHIPALEFLTVMLGDQPVVAPATCYYQRLLARDQREAGEILDTCLKDTSLESIYDSVVIPALVLAQENRFEGDLDESTIDFIRQATRELIDELGFRYAPETETEKVSAVPERTRLRAVKVLCVPVRDEADELAAMMLSQLLEAEGMESAAIAVPRMDEIQGAVAAANPEVVFLCGLPPFAMARAHRLYRSLRGRYPDKRVMIGIWAYTEDVARAAQRMSRGETVPVFTSLAGAMAEMRSFAGAGAAPVAMGAGNSSSTSGENAA